MAGWDVGSVESARVWRNIRIGACVVLLYQEE
jgi:hypothetical protein